MLLRAEAKARRRKLFKGVGGGSGCDWKGKGWKFGSRWWGEGRKSVVVCVRGTWEWEM